MPKKNKDDATRDITREANKPSKRAIKKGQQAGIAKGKAKLKAQKKAVKIIANDELFGKDIPRASAFDGKRAKRKRQKAVEGAFKSPGNAKDKKRLLDMAVAIDKSADKKRAAFKAEGKKAKQAKSKIRKVGKKVSTTVGKVKQKVKQKVKKDLQVKAGQRAGIKKGLAKKNEQEQALKSVHGKQKARKLKKEIKKSPTKGKRDFLDATVRLARKRKKKK